jgi:hypothetical protein
MVNELKVELYKAFYKYLSKHIKKTLSWSDWEILKKHQDFMHSLEKETVYEHKTEQIQIELNDFIKKHLESDFSKVQSYAKSFNPKIKEEISPVTEGQGGVGNFVAFVVTASLTHNAAIKTRLKNTYYALATMRQCLDENGLLLDEINKRVDYRLFNFVIKDKSTGKSKTIAHYHISKETLDGYVNFFNAGQSMRVNGKFIAFKNENDVIITATKLKNQEELDLYKKRYRIYGDNDFTRKPICVDVTHDLISSRVQNNIHTEANKNTFKELVANNEIMQAIDKALERSDLSNEDDKNLILLKSRLNELKDYKIKGISENGEYSRSFNAIKIAFLEVISSW